MAPSEGCAGLAILAAVYHSGVSLLQRWCCGHHLSIDHQELCMLLVVMGTGPWLLVFANPAAGWCSNHHHRVE